MAGEASGIIDDDDFPDGLTARPLRARPTRYDLEQQIAALRTERDALRATVAGLREGLEWIRDAAKDMQDGKESAGMALIRIEDFAAYSLGLAAAPPATPASDTSTGTEDEYDEFSDLRAGVIPPATPAPDGRDTNDG